MKDILDKKFIHHAWFKEGVTRKYALDYFAKNTKMFVLGKKKSRQQTMELFAEVRYNDIITDGHYSYKLYEEEKEYYSQRKKYYDEQKKIKYEKWLNTIRDEAYINKELNIYKGEYDYNVKTSKYNLKYFFEDKDKDIETINFWKKELKKAAQQQKIVNDIIIKYKNIIKTNKDLIDLKNEIDNVV